MEIAMLMLDAFAADEHGATALEYGLIAALIALAILASMTTLGENLEATWQKLADAMS